jgi:hypothetical protein
LREPKTRRNGAYSAARFFYNRAVSAIASGVSLERSALAQESGIGCLNSAGAALTISSIAIAGAESVVPARTGMTMEAMRGAYV